MNYQAADHLLELFVAELDLIDVGGSGGLEEIGAQGIERQIIAACRLGDAVWSVALIAQAEKGSQRLIQVSAVQTALIFALHPPQFAQPVEAITGSVGGIANWALDKIGR